MNEKELRQHRCCFTGHRPHKLNISENEVKDLLQTAIKKAINDGFTTFISGMACGIDMWAAELVLEEKKYDDRIKLICASPYEGFEKRWSDVKRKCYNDIMQRADYVKYVCEHYSRQCFQIRNVFMVDHSSRVIAAYNGESGGTKNTIRYAKGKGVEIVNILEYGEI